MEITSLEHALQLHNTLVTNNLALWLLRAKMLFLLHVPRLASPRWINLVALQFYTARIQPDGKNDFNKEAYWYLGMKIPNEVMYNYNDACFYLDVYSSKDIITMIYIFIYSKDKNIAARALIMSAFIQAHYQIYNTLTPKEKEEFQEEKREFRKRSLDQTNQQS